MALQCNMTCQQTFIQSTETPEHQNTEPTEKHALVLHGDPHASLRAEGRARLGWATSQARSPRGLVKWGGRAASAKLPLIAIA